MTGVRRAYVTVDLAAARYCAQVVERLYRGRELPEPIRRHVDHLAACASASESANPGPQLGHDHIGTTEAARILGCTTARVRAIAEHVLDGTKPGRDWQFDRATVIAYAAGRRPGRRCG